MSVAETFESVKHLSRADKLRLMHILIVELAKEEDAVLDASNLIGAVHNSYEVAEAMLNLL